MNPVSSLNPNARKWIAALRSGLFQQGNGYLRKDEENGPTLCCLGVACELAILDGVEIKKKRNEADGIYRYEETESILPEEVRKWLGLRSSDGGFDKAILFGFSDRAHSLTQLNDHARYDFNMIADFVELNPPGLFGDPNEIY